MIPRLLGPLCIMVASASCVISIDSWDSDSTIWIEKTETRELSAAGVQALAATTHNGHIHASAAAETPDTITVTITTKAGAHSQEQAQACMEALRVITEKSGDQQVVKWKWDGHKKRNWKAQVSYDIKLPSTLALKAITHNGGIEARGIGMSCHARSHNGAIHVENSGDEVVAETHNGPIELHSRAKKLNAKTHNGAITAHVNTTGAIQGRLETHNGGIIAYLNDSSSAQIRCSTDNGSIRIQRTLQDISSSRDHFHGRLGDGTTTLELTTHNGSIRIR